MLAFKTSGNYIHTKNTFRKMNELDYVKFDWIIVVYITCVCTVHGMSMQQK